MKDNTIKQDFKNILDVAHYRTFDIEDVGVNTYKRTKGMSWEESRDEAVNALYELVEERVELNDEVNHEHAKEVEEAHRSQLKELRELVTSYHCGEHKKLLSRLDTLIKEQND